MFFVSAVSTGLYFYQKKEITRKENMLRSYFSEISADSIASTDGEMTDTGRKDGNAISSAGLQESKEGAKIFVYICGEVHDPGVYELDHDSRVSDLLGLCGGAGDLACLEAINLAKKLEDGERIYIPSKDEVSAASIDLSNADWSASSGIATGLTNINEASIEELLKLPGIGEQIAKNIIDYRKKYGAFRSKEDIKNVSGIGDKKYEQIEELISI